MAHKIRDLRNNPEAVKERDAEELAHKLWMFGALWHLGKYGKQGDVIKQLSNRFNFKDIKSEHTEKERIIDK